MNSIGIPAEHKNIHERRAALVPHDVGELVRQGSVVSVQRSNIRIFKESEYERVGAQIVDGPPDSDIIVGVKERPINEIDGRWYMIFSHTIKGQPYNMPALRKYIETGSTLIDYELIKDVSGRRLVAFGRFAGIAGMNDTLYVLGEKLYMQGIKTPFWYFRPANTYHNVEDMFLHLSMLQDRVLDYTWDGPFVIGIAGYGRVSMGAQEVLRSLNIREIHVEDLPKLNKKGVYFVVFREEHLVERRTDGGFDLQEYYNHPELYRSIFDRHLPYLDVFMNCIYYEDRYPALVDRDLLLRLDAEGRLKLKVIGDISCDIKGAVRFTTHCTASDSPAFTYLFDIDKFSQWILPHGITVMAVDNLPAELARDSSTEFSRTILPYIQELIRADLKAPFDKLDLPEELLRAIIVYHGELVPSYRYLEKYL